MKINRRMTDFEITYCTDVGTEKDINQDSALMMTADTQDGPVSLLMVCDGMGGITMGEYASGSVVRYFADWFERVFPDRMKDGVTIEEIGREWKDMLIGLDCSFREYGRENNLKMGTTITGMLFWNNRYLLAQSGDSRAYEIGWSVRQLSEDQSYVQNQIKLGKLTLEEAKRHPKRSVLTDCIGGSRPSVPVCTYGRVKRDRVYLLCSDGFVHEIAGRELLHMQTVYKGSRQAERQRFLRGMVESVKLRGERDNITAVTVKTSGKLQHGEDRGFFFHLREKIISTETKAAAEELVVTDSEE